MIECLFIGVFLSILVIYLKSVFFYNGVLDIKEWKERAKFVLLLILGGSYIFLIYGVAICLLILLFGVEINWDILYYLFYICSCIFFAIGLPSLMTTVTSFVVIKKTQRENEKRIKEASNKIQSANGRIKEDIRKLNILRTNVVDADHTKTTCDLCKLIYMASNHCVASTQCLSFAMKQEKILKAQRIIEERITNLAKQYETVGDLEKAEYYMNIVNANR